MKFSLAIEVSLLAAGLVAANGTKSLTGPPALRRASAIFARQTIEFCDNGGTSCEECYGSGNIVCEVSHCFNPGAGERCCADGKYCEAPDNGDDCCDNDGGLSSDDEGGDGEAPSTSRASTRPSSVFSSAFASPTGDSDWECEASDSNEECCKRGDDDYEYCPGGDTSASINCYDPTEGFVCCNDGSSCPGTGCCGSVGIFSSAPAAASSRVSTRATGVSLNTGAPSTRPVNPTAKPTDDTTNGGEAQETSAPPGAANANGARGVAVAAVAGVLGLALL